MGDKIKYPIKHGIRYYMAWLREMKKRWAEIRRKMEISDIITNAIEREKRKRK